MAISKTASVVTAPHGENARAAISVPVDAISASAFPAGSHRQQSGNVTKRALLNQFEDEFFSQKISSFFASIIETVDAIDRLLARAISNFPQSMAITDETDQQKKKAPPKRYATDRNTQSANIGQVADLFSDVIEKADSVLKKLDELLLYSVSRLSGFSCLSHEQSPDPVDENVVAETVHPINIALPKIVAQTGHICKPTALANLDAYYAQRHGIFAMPLRKNHKLRYSTDSDGNTARRSPVSIRALSKQHGSIQGEVLEAETYRQLAKNLGYSVDVMTPDDPAAFKKMVLDYLAKGQPLVTCFAVDRENGRPQSHYDDNEHACVITGCDPVANTIEIAHWGKTFRDIRIEDMFDSMNALPAEREQEIYYRCEDFSGAPHLEAANLKYDKEDRRIKGGEEGKKESIIPAPASGFKNKVFAIVPDSNSPRWNQRPPANHVLA